MISRRASGGAGLEEKKPTSKSGLASPIGFSGRAKNLDPISPYSPGPIGSGEMMIMQDEPAVGHTRKARYGGDVLLPYKGSVGFAGKMSG